MLTIFLLVKHLSSYARLGYAVEFYIFTIMASVYEIKCLQLVQLLTFGHREHLIAFKLT